jgi:hypothetical protein
MSENRGTGWWSKRDLNLRPVLTEYLAEGATFFAQFRRTSLSENLFAKDSAEFVANGRGWSPPARVGQIGVIEEERFFGSS